MKTSRLALLVLLALPITRITPAFAADLRNVLTDYTLTSWDQKDGLPSGNIWSLAQDADGYLWVGSDAGLFRFDGVRFVPSEMLGSPRLPSAAVRAVRASSQGDVWVGFGGSGGVSRIKNGHTHTYGEADGLPAGPVAMLVEDSSGSMWIGNDHGLYRFARDQWEKWQPGRGLPKRAIYGGYNDRRGRLVIENEVGIFRQTDKQERFEPLEIFDEAMQTAIRGVVPRGISADAAGDIWMTDPIVGFRKVGDRPKLVSSWPDRGRGTRLLHDRAGNLWVSTGGQGLWRVRLQSDTHAPIVERVTSLTGLLADGVYALLEDRDGNVWAGTTQGLNRLTPRKITQFVDLGLVRGVEVTPDGSVWVGTIDGLVQFVRASDKARHWDQPTGSRLTALHVDEHGTLWVATDRNLMRLVGGHLAVVPLRRSQQPHQVESITSDFQGGIWLYDSDAGLQRWNGKHPRAVQLPAEVRQHRVVVTYTDSSGRVWVGFPGGEIAVINPGGQAHLYGTRDGLGAGTYLAIYEDEDGIVWLGGTEGLSRFAHARFVTVRRESAFPADYVTAIVEDASRALWLGTRLGIVRIDRSEFDRTLANPSYSAHYSVYNNSDGIAGMPVARSNNRRAIRAPDGRLWFVTARGMTVIDPKVLQATRLTGSVHIERIVADQQELHQRPHITLAPGTRSLEIDYTVLDLTSPFKTRFRYRLEGFDRDWIEAGTRRQAFYTNLPPRPYRFRVAAKNNQGPWVEAGASWDFSIRPMFYQTAWFYFASTTALAFSLWLAWRFRIRQVRKQFTLILGERVRLSREIHDTLLQGVVGLALQFDALAHDVDGPTPEKRQQFIRVRRQMEEYIREARQAIWDLRSPKAYCRDLIQALRDAGEHATASNAISFEFNVSGMPKRCPQNLEEQLLKIGKEAIVNAVHHGQANRICVELQYDDASLTLQVSDDGLGFDLVHVANQGQAHYGLLSMKERAEEVGGGFTIASSIGRGTRVTAVVPTNGHA